MALNILHPGKITETTKATEAEALAGLDNRKYMTPLRTKQSLGVEIEQAIEAVADQYDDVLAMPELPQTGVSGRLYIVGNASFHWNGSGYDQVGFGAAGRKLFLGADGVLRSVDSDGVVETLLAAPTPHQHTTYSPNAPADPAEADRWVDTNTLRAYEFVGGAWIEIVSS